MFKWVIAAVAWFLAFTVTLRAEQRELYYTAKSIGRGGAMLADVDDYNSLLINPAGIAILNESTFIMEMQIESSMGFNDFLTAYFGSNTQGKIPSEDKLAFFRDQNDRARLGGIILYARKNFGLALITAGTIDADYSDEVLPTVDVFSAADIATQISFARGFLDKEKLRIGFTGKTVFRMGKSGNMDFSELTESGIAPFGDFATYGVALAADIGIQYTWFREKYEFSIGMSALDLGTPFLTANQVRPVSLSSRVSIGTGLKVPNLFKKTGFKINLDVCKSVVAMEANAMDLIHFGIEMIFPQFLSIRAGLNQMYWTAGLGVKYWLLEVDFATYAENIWADNNGRKASDRRYLFQAKVYF